MGRVFKGSPPPPLLPRDSAASVPAPGSMSPASLCPSVAAEPPRKVGSPMRD